MGKVRKGGRDLVSIVRDGDVVGAFVIFSGGVERWWCSRSTLSSCGSRLHGIVGAWGWRSFSWGLGLWNLDHRVLSQFLKLCFLGGALGLGWGCFGGMVG